MKICFTCLDTNKAAKSKKKLTKLYGNFSVEKSDVIVALGGDGFLLKTIHDYKNFNKPIYGMNLGSIGFLMNEYSENKLIETINNSEKVKIKPIRMTAKSKDNKIYKSLAFNEVSLIRETHQAAKVSIKINSVLRMKELICDGVLLSTPAGSTAYNLSAHGPIIPLGTNALALTPISAFRPRRWRGALIKENTNVQIEVLNYKKRPVSVTADHFEFRDIKKVEMKIEKNFSQILLFNSVESFDERILKEQFIK